MLLGGPSAALAAPGNDDFAQARTLRVGTTIKGSINGATRQRGEPRHAPSKFTERLLAKYSVWYRFSARRKLALRLSTCRADFDSVVVVYSGRSCFGGSRVTFTTRRGRVYWIAVAGYDPTGSFRLKAAAIRTPRNDDFVDAAPLPLGSTVSGTTRNATRELGELGYRDDHSVWFRFRVATAHIVRLGACMGNGNGLPIAVYTGARVDRLALVADYNRCWVQFTARPGVTYRVRGTTSGEGAGGFRLSARVATPPANDNFADATPLTLGTAANGTTRDASAEPTESYSYPSTVWYRLTISAATTAALSACTDIFFIDATLSLHVAIFQGDQLRQLRRRRLTAFPDCRQQLELQPGVYSIQVSSREETDFTLRADAVTPPP